MTKTIRHCNTCNRPFQAEMKEVRRGGAKYCSLSCSSKRPKPPKAPNFICANCSTSFYRSPSSAKGSKSGLMFCSRRCKEEMQSLKNGISPIQPSHYGNGSGINYRILAYRYYDKKCNVCGYDKHPEILVVHHKDHDRTNNELDNLEILCPTHHNEHHYLTNSGPWSPNKWKSKTVEEG